MGLKDVFESSKADIKNQLRGLENKKASLEERQGKLIELLIDGDIPRDALKKKQDDLQKEIQETELQIEHLKFQCKIDYQLIEELLYFTRNIYQTYMESPDYLKRHFLRLFYERIYVRNGKIVKMVEQPIFSTLRQQEKVILKGLMLPD